MDVDSPIFDVGPIVHKFYQLLTRYETFPAAKNFFGVQINDIPTAITDDHVKELGFGRTDSRGIHAVKPQFESMIGSGNTHMLIATGVDLNTEKTTVTSQSEPYKNGLLPTGPYTTGHEYGDQDLDIQFLETNISFIDGIIRPWIQLYSTYGNMQLNLDEPKLSTNIDVIFTSRQLPEYLQYGVADYIYNQPTDTSHPVIRKIYKYYNCIPHEITSANVNEYTGDFETGSISTKWRFSRYDVITPTA